MKKDKKILEALGYALEVSNYVLMWKISSVIEKRARFEQQLAELEDKLLEAKEPSF